MAYLLQQLCSFPVNIRGCFGIVGSFNRFHRVKHELIVGGFLLHTVSG